MATKNNVGGFKQMPKMETTEPTVILKMKKGGHVNTKHLAKGENGYSTMSSNNKFRESMEVDGGDAPKKPSMTDRKKAMNPNFKDGGKVPNMRLGGALKRMLKGVAAPQKMAAAIAAPALNAMKAPSGMMGKAIMAATPMNKTIMSGLSNMKSKTLQPMAGRMSGMKEGGKADMSQDKAMIKKAFKQHDMQEHQGGKGTKLSLKNGGKMATGGVMMGKPGGYAAGGTINGNEAQYKNTKVVDGDKNNPAKGTGGVRMGNAGGYAQGGDVSWENRPANTAKPGKVNTKTGEVRNGNAGGYKAGGNASKKAYATGGTVNDEGKAVKMPARPVSRPVANSLQSGTFAEGGSTSNKYTVKNPKAVSDKASRELEDAMNPLSMAKELYGKGKDYFTMPAGSVTKTEKSVTVSPGKKRGGKVC
jgi:hypothetical protein